LACQPKSSDKWLEVVENRIRDSLEIEMTRLSVLLMGHVSVANLPERVSSTNARLG
jgi:hypothetical protein